MKGDVLAAGESGEGGAGEVDDGDIGLVFEVAPPAGGWHGPDAKDVGGGEVAEEFFRRGVE
jgi:hypothetical protein